MVKSGFQASYKKFSPLYLKHLVQLADKAGLDLVLSSDHITPWSNTHHQRGFSLSWLEATMQAISMSYGVPGYRYHPAVFAQAFATLSQMFPHHFFPVLEAGRF